MNRDEFIKHRWKGYEVVVYKNDRMKNFDGGLGVEIECMVCSINFDDEIVLLQSVIPNVFRDDEFYASIKNIVFQKRKLVIKK